MLKIYLAGPIRDYSNKWRGEVTQEFFIKYFGAVQCINPEIIEVDADSPTSIVNLDINSINKCDIVLANITELSAGTSMELVYSHQMRKTVVLACDEELLSPWHIYHATFVENTLKGAMKRIFRYIDLKL